MRCEGFSDVPYTAMRSYAPTCWVKEQCTEEAEEGKNYCKIHQMEEYYEKEYWKNVTYGPGMKEFLDKFKEQK